MMLLYVTYLKFFTLTILEFTHIRKKISSILSKRSEELYHIIFQNIADLIKGLTSQRGPKRCNKENNLKNKPQRSHIRAHVLCLILLKGKLTFIHLYYLLSWHKSVSVLNWSETD